MTYGKGPPCIAAVSLKFAKKNTSSNRSQHPPDTNQGYDVKRGASIAPQQLLPLAQVLLVTQATAWDTQLPDTSIGNWKMRGKEDVSKKDTMFLKEKNTVNIKLCVQNDQYNHLNHTCKKKKGGIWSGSLDFAL